ncbi:MAG: hypothetical protein WKF73_02810 [Nocardioidaceae bacterium]
MTRRVISKEVPGIAEAIRAYGVSNGIPTAVLVARSRPERQGRR